MVNTKIYLQARVLFLFGLMCVNASMFILTVLDDIRRIENDNKIR